MKKRLLGLALSLITLAGCGGKNEQVAANNNVSEDVVLAVRTFGQDVNIPEGERTQVALLYGQIETFEDAQEAAKTAEWVPINQIDTDDNFTFIDTQGNMARPMNFSTEVVAKEMSRGGYHHGGHHRRGHNRGYRRGYRQGYRQGSRHGYWGAPHWRGYRHGARWGGYGVSVVGGSYWGVNSCGYNSIAWGGGRCVVPYTPRYHRTWVSRANCVMPMSYRSSSVRVSGSAHVGFYF